MIFEPFKCLILKNNLFTESRFSFEGIEEKNRDDGKKGIRFHNSITAFFLRLLGKKIVDIKDITGKVYHINRGSLGSWIGLNGREADSRFTPGQDFSLVTESGMTYFLNTVIRKKAENSPAARKNVAIAKLENELADLERAKLSRDRANRPGNWSIYERNLENAIAETKNRLNTLQSQR